MNKAERDTCQAQPCVALRSAQKWRWELGDFSTQHIRLASLLLYITSLIHFSCYKFQFLHFRLTFSTGFNFSKMQKKIATSAFPLEVNKEVEKFRGWERNITMQLYHEDQIRNDFWKIPCLLVTWRSSHAPRPLAPQCWAIWGTIHSSEYSHKTVSVVAWDNS